MTDRELELHEMLEDNEKAQRALGRQRQRLVEVIGYDLKPSYDLGLGDLVDVTGEWRTCMGQRDADGDGMDTIILLYTGDASPDEQVRIPADRLVPVKFTPSEPF